MKTTICQQTVGCTRRAPSVKLRHLVDTLEPPELRERLYKACEKCSMEVVFDFCRTHSREKCAIASCYRLLEPAYNSLVCVRCQEKQRERQRSNYHAKKRRNEQSADEGKGLYCTHCSAFIPPEKMARRTRGKPGWVEKCEVCLEHNRRTDAKRRRR